MIFIKLSVCSSTNVSISVYVTYSTFCVVARYSSCAVKAEKVLLKRKVGLNPAFPIQAVDSEAC